MINSAAIKARAMLVAYWLEIIGQAPVHGSATVSSSLLIPEGLLAYVPRVLLSPFWAGATHVSAARADMDRTAGWPKSEGGTLIVSLSTPLRAPPILPYCFRYCLDRRHPTRKVAAAGRHSRRARRLSTTKARHISSSQSDGVQS